VSSRRSLDDGRSLIDDGCVEAGGGWAAANCEEPMAMLQMTA
jgi:hypothetical protein